MAYYESDIDRGIRIIAEVVNNGDHKCKGCQTPLTFTHFQDLKCDQHQLYLDCKGCRSRASHALTGLQIMEHRNDLSNLLSHVVEGMIDQHNASHMDTELDRELETLAGNPKEAKRVVANYDRWRTAHGDDMDEYENYGQF